MLNAIGATGVPPVETPELPPVTTQIPVPKRAPHHATPGDEFPLCHQDPVPSSQRVRCFTRRRQAATHFLLSGFRQNYTTYLSQHSTVRDSQAAGGGSRPQDAARDANILRHCLFHPALRCD